MGVCILLYCFPSIVPEDKDKLVNIHLDSFDRSKTRASIPEDLSQPSSIRSEGSSVTAAACFQSGPTASTFRSYTRHQWQRVDASNSVTLTLSPEEIFKRRVYGADHLKTSLRSTRALLTLTRSHLMAHRDLTSLDSLVVCSVCAIPPHIKGRVKLVIPSCLLSFSSQHS